MKNTIVDALAPASTDKPKPIPRRKKFLFSLITCLVLILAFLSLGEILSRKALGKWVVKSPTAILISDPAGPYYALNSTLGYLPNAGKTNVTLPGPYSFTITHLPDGTRITHPLETYPGKPKKEIWIFGCSLTEGWTLNDQETYPWLLQKKFSDYEVVNFGVAGYSTVQSLIQLREALLKRKKPILIVLAYASFHDQRNTLTRAWVKTRVTSGAAHYLGTVNLPYMAWSNDRQPELRYQPLEYREVPLARYSALANLLDSTYDRLVETTYHSHDISRKLIEQFYDLCKANQIDFVVAGIFSDASTREMLDYCRSKGIPATDISVDLRIRENTNLPYDDHPSALANLEYERTLESFLCTQLKSEPVCGPQSQGVNK